VYKNDGDSWPANNDPRENGPHDSDPTSRICSENVCNQRPLDGEMGGRLKEYHCGLPLVDSNSCVLIEERFQDSQDCEDFVIIRKNEAASGNNEKWVVVGSLLTATKDFAVGILHGGTTLLKTQQEYFDAVRLLQDAHLSIVPRSFASGPLLQNYEPPIVATILPVPYSLDSLEHSRSLSGATNNEK